MSTAVLAARLVLAGVFALASITKLTDLRGSRAAVAGFGVPERIASPLGTLLPFAELAVALALLPAGSARDGALAAGALLLVFVAAIARSMARGEAPDCHCFGQLHSEPAGRGTLARNLVLVALAAFVAAAGWGDPGPSATAWVGRLGGAGVVALAGGLALAAVVALTTWAVLGLLRQNGRMLLRIEELEARLDPTGQPAPAAAVAHHGLPLGSPAPAFSLGGLYGETVTLESLISAETPVLTGGSDQDNRAKIREHGIASVWLDDGLAVYNAYRAPGTPSAVLIDGQGRVASDVVGGVEAISGLVDDATRAPAAPVRQVPAAGTPVMPVRQVPVRQVPAAGAQAAPLGIGAPAPALELGDLAGKPVSLTVPDRDTLVLFWNPGCGFCERMLEDVRSLERSSAPGAPRLLLISTGSVADNERLALNAPIALDQAFAAGAAFGSTGTPSAVLVGRDGRVASAVAVGASEVMALATAASEWQP
jgi:thiol-disulfide isomerase/thioredoxin